MSSKPTVSMIVAMDRNRLIGADNRLPWRLPADMAFFKQTTMGHPVLMGRKTYESIGKPLPGRLNIVLTRDPNFSAEGCEIARTVDEALRIAGDRELFVIGGAQVYELFAPIAMKLYVTQVEGDFAGDTHFQEIDENEWELAESRPGVVDERNVHAHDFLTYLRKHP
ncbi:dihydrofolate reductase [Paenibacillus hodogayensis]|uniref:Dihydrofolate reductase n=1 Tax=Paenibacillus hodogayensis TaxID=279208 RepID=A0ABV5W776_9BACL